MEEKTHATHDGFFDVTNKVLNIIEMVLALLSAILAAVFVVAIVPGGIFVTSAVFWRWIKRRSRWSGVQSSLTTNQEKGGF